MGTGKSLIRQTFERFLKLCPAENIFIVTNGIYKDLVLEHLPELTENQVLCEPSRNNTAPCVAYTAFKLHNLNPDANFIVAPSDHIILKEDAFIDYLQTALNFTEQKDALVTLGIQPTRPDTGYGYINFSANGSNIHKVVEFKEKPNEATAKTYLESGDYLWNAGIFVWKAANVLEQFQKHATEIYDILKEGEAVYNTKEEQAFIDKAYPTTPSISVDYAIMEKSSDVYTIPSEFGWSDLGTWNSLHLESPKAENGNAVNGKAVLDEVSNTLIRMPKGKLLVAKGLDDFIIVDEGDVLLIYPKSKEQEIKAVTKGIEEKEYL
jgi:mannose-1-phosphate guanylyltransferase